MTTPAESADNRKLITPELFFSSPAEKRKLNWFLFELALEIESTIRRDRQLCARLERKGVDAQARANFCVYQAKQMLPEILDRVAGRTERVYIGYEKIEAYFPRLGDRLVDCLLTKVAAAWDSLTAGCAMCPTRCISEMNAYAPMFDDPSHLS